MHNFLIFLDFVLSSFWKFIGFFMLMVFFLSGIEDIFKAIFSKRSNKWEKVIASLEKHNLTEIGFTHKGDIRCLDYETMSRLPSSHICGHIYRIAESGLYCGLHCKIGDHIICIKTGNEDNINDWIIIHRGDK